MVWLRRTRALQDLKIYLYDPKGRRVGTIRDELQLLDVECQIKENKESGWSIMYKGRKYEIEPWGHIQNFYIDNPNAISKMLRKLVP